MNMHEKGFATLTESQKAMLAPHGACGYVEAIHGEGGHECDEYRPTRYELQQLARYWATVALDINLDFFLYGQTGSTAIRMRPYAEIRLQRLAEVLGDQAIEKMRAEADEEARRRVGEEYWWVFTDGTPGERDAVLNEHHQSLEYLDEKRADEGTQQKAFAHLRQNACGFYLDDAGDLWSFTEPPVAANGRDARLVLKVTTSQGAARLIPRYSVERPRGWHPPFGLR